MSLTLTKFRLASRGKGYHNRVMVYAHRRHKAFYLPPKKAHANSPLTNKEPEEYGNTWDARCGIEWYYRTRRRNHYRHWPWARWTDDPIRHHSDPTNRRTISALSEASNEGVPEWNYYEEVGQDYATPSHFPLTYVGPFIHQYTGKVWSRDRIRNYLEVIQTGTHLRTIQDVAQHLPDLRAWGERQLDASGPVMETDNGSAHGKPVVMVPCGFLQHVELVVADIVKQNDRKRFREEQHMAGVLRTRDMVRYYTLPYLKGPAMPEKLKQPSGEYPWGKYTYMKGTVKIHPLQLPDRRYTRNMYPL
ncbi:unnamed protein product [Phytomonas sp. EM1]|nr:unnamed protein product [Phytomonas sp. EM1]|eukprot:CCW60410.1 unnamed protein product [Phytomonas sp. isolate EM1]